MFGWFKKKAPEPEPVPAPAQPVKEPLEVQVLRCVAEQAPGSILEGNRLAFPSCGGLTMAVSFPELDGPRFQMEARLEHPDFFGPLIETTAGAAEDDGDKARFAARQIVDSVLDALLPALRGEGEETPPVQLWGRTHRFRASVSGVLLMYAQQPPEGQDLWSRMADAVTACLGSKPVYWVKLYMAHLGDGTTSCEVRINGWVVPELTETLTQLAKSWPLEGQPMRSAKQYVVLVQEEATRTSCPYTWEDARDLTREAIRLFENGTAYNDIPKELEKSARTPSLAEDVFRFMPELMTSTLLPGAKATSQFTLQPEGKAPQTVWFTQCRTWDPVYTAICDHLNQDQPSREQLMKIVGTSAMSHALSNALNAGSKMEDLVLSQAFLVSGGYQLW